MMSATHLTSHSGIGEAAAAAAVKSSPPLAAVGAMATGMTLNNWVAVATLVYVVLQAAYLVWKWARELRAKKADANV